MQWDDNFDLSFTKKASGSKERRTSKTLDDLQENSPRNPEDALPRTKKTGVWAEEDKATKSKSGTNIIELERFQKDKGEPEDEIPVIPDIDDLQDDPLNLPDVKKLVSVDESTYKELEDQFDSLKGSNMNFGNLGDIDLSFLTAKLYPESEVQSCNDAWTMESLYMDLSKSSV